MIYYCSLCQKVIVPQPNMECFTCQEIPQSHPYRDRVASKQVSVIDDQFLDEEDRNKYRRPPRPIVNTPPRPIV